VYSSFRRWRLSGRRLAIYDALRGRVRTQAGKHKQPSVAIIESKSVTTASK
jgi:hypothetical protein